MRVISGKVRGLKLSCPAGLETRPTLDRVKEAVFSMILPYIADASVLDLFAGSGGLGIEALSRGAKKACFIDNCGQAIKCIRENLALCKFEDVSTVFNIDAETFLKRTNQEYDLILLDPPYFDGKYIKTIELIKENHILTNDGIIVVEWDAESGFSAENEGFRILKEKKYGRVCVTVLKWG